MSGDSRHVLVFADDALNPSTRAVMPAAVLRDLASDHLLGFFDSTVSTPVTEWAKYFHDLGPVQVSLFPFNRLFPGRAVARDFEYVRQRIEDAAFTPSVVYFAGQSYRYLRLAVVAAEHYDLPMVVLHTDNWMDIALCGSSQP